MKPPFVFRKISGFTLIELLVVMAIIAILISIGLASFNRAQQQARDSQRKSDLQNVAGALEIFYGDFNKYPTAVADKIDDADCTGGSLDWGSEGLNCGGKSYLKQLPDNPTGSDYIYQSSGQIFCLIANLETKDTADMTCPVDNVDYEFVVSSQD